MVRNHTGSMGVADSGSLYVTHGQQTPPRSTSRSLEGIGERARRLAGGLLDGPDRERLLNYSAELEQKAAVLQAGAEGTASDTERRQQEPE